MSRQRATRRCSAGVAVTGAGEAGPADVVVSAAGDPAVLCRDLLVRLEEG